MTTVQTKCTEGLEERFKLAALDEESTVLLTMWIHMIAKNMRSLGLDTVFKIPNQSFTEEQDILVNWTALATIDIGA